MANVNVTSDAWTEISITSGTVQNISATADIELSAEKTDNSGVVLKPSEIYQWDNKTIYARAVTEETGALRVVNFKRATGGGGYVLPVATASTLGGVKVGGGLDIDENGVLSAPVSYSTTEQVIGTWIDGKPLYKITVEVNSPSAENVFGEVFDFQKNISIVSIDGFLAQSASVYAPLNFAYDTNGSVHFIATWVQYNNNSAQIYMGVNPSDYVSRPCYITVKYTKNAD